jgi:hypothetical protein
MLNDLFVIKVAAIVLALFGLGYFLLNRFKSNKSKDFHFKYNVTLLREEKLLIHTDKKIQNRRKQLLKKIKNSEYVNQKQLINKSKKLGVPLGEILLAAKIQMNCK